MDDEFLEVIDLITSALTAHIEEYFDGVPTPENILFIEEYLNNFVFTETLPNGMFFQVELFSECAGEMSVLVHCYPDGIEEEDP